MDSKENFRNINLVEDALLLVEQNFYFLHAGEFFTSLLKEKDLTIKNDVTIQHLFKKQTNQDIGNNFWLFFAEFIHNYVILTAN